jgi:hypothetical protein
MMVIELLLLRGYNVALSKGGNESQTPKKKKRGRVDDKVREAVDALDAS